MDPEVEEWISKMRAQSAFSIALGVYCAQTCRALVTFWTLVDIFLGAVFGTRGRFVMRSGLCLAAAGPLVSGCATGGPTSEEVLAGNLAPKNRGSLSIERRR